MKDYIVPLRVGRLIVGKFAGYKRRKRQFHTTCECGVESIKYGDSLKGRNEMRCGKDCKLGAPPIADTLPKAVGGWLYG